MADNKSKSLEEIENEFQEEKEEKVDEKTSETEDQEDDDELEKSREDEKKDKELLESRIDHVLPINLSNCMQDSFLSYAMSVIVARALPDVRDGLKPVQRRI